MERLCHQRRYLAVKFDIPAIKADTRCAELDGWQRWKVMTKTVAMRGIRRCSLRFTVLSCGTGEDFRELAPEYHI